MQLKWSPALSSGSLAIHLLSEIGLYIPLSVEYLGLSHSAAKLAFFGGDSIEVLRVAPAAPADLAGVSLDRAGPCAGVQVEERLFILEASLFSPFGGGAEVTLEVTFRLVSSGS